ncbi:SDR family NAD(P)-dependent oxidoreductase [Exiguobacterium algae]|uniref:SDR family NAD(P)-dependent oxidoreductase n=1 Tax=Exiguobacterium algae TaxID=2751250 RepID=UPI003B82D601
MDDLSKTALITGASMGIGLDLAVLAARDGYDCILISRNEPRLHELKKVLEKRYRIQVHVFAMDLSEHGAAKRLTHAIEEAGLTVDFLINNAGFGTAGAFADLDAETEAEEVRLNVNALTELTKAYLPEMVARNHGYVLNVASVAAFQPGPYMAVYYATKAYVLSLTEALHAEVKGTGVHVSVLCPGPTDTDFFNRAGSELMMSKMPSHLVAFFGYKGVMQNKRVIVPGLSNQLLVGFAKLMPRALSLEILRRVQKPGETATPETT